MTTAFVTGGNRGLGYEIIKSLLIERPECRVVLGSRSLQAGQAAALTLGNTYGAGRVVAMQIDVTSRPSIDAAVAAVCRQTQHLDILINNSGVLLDSDDPSVLFDLEAARTTLRVNLDGAISVTEAFLPLLSRTATASILFTSSGQGTRALGQLSEAHRLALDAPGLDTPRLKKIFAQMVEDLADASNPYHAIPSPSYSLSKLGLNCYTQVDAPRNSTP